MVYVCMLSFVDVCMLPSLSATICRKHRPARIQLSISFGILFILLRVCHFS